MKLIGRKHGFRIGSGRTVRRGFRLANLNVEAYKKFFGTASQLLEQAQVQIFVEHNQNTFEACTRKYCTPQAVPKSGDSNHVMIKQEREQKKLER